MQIDSLNLKLHGSLLSGLALTMLLAGVAVNRAFEDIAAKQKQTRIHQAKLQTIAEKAEVTQAYIDKHIPLYDGVNLDQYVCDPLQPPQFNWRYYVDQIKAGHKTKKLWVTDASLPARIIGYIDETGWRFEPERCQ
ncbi:MAG: hypothetical protein QNJ46_12715 [Leptolyngbyaceae cyanobacterium MO_188.B28]|nr:hypothetical protein [Leptolyngbyaceae cyanobacterium MO_188.B28]